MKVSTIPAYLRSYVSSRPSYLILYVTSRCNQKCEFCFYADSLNAPWKDGLSLDEITRLARSMYPCVHATLTGGEPFLRQDIVAVTRALVDHAGVRNVTFPTNGSFPDRVAAALEELCLACPDVEFRIALSIDAVGDHHDRIRGFKGAFAKATETFGRVKGLQKRFSNLHLAVVSVASKYNKNELRSLVDYVAENLRCDDYSLLLARGNTKMPDARDVTSAEFDALVKYVAEKIKPASHAPAGLHGKLLGLIERETRFVAAATLRDGKQRYSCVAGEKLVVVYDSGDVHPCEILDTLEEAAATKATFGGSFKLGNIRDYGFDMSALLASERAQAVRKYIDDSRCRCTFECAIAASMVFKPTALARTLLNPPSKA